MDWYVFVYRKLCEVDVLARLQGNHGMKRFEILHGPEALMRGFFDDFCRCDQVLAVELQSLGNVVARHDRLVDLVDPLKNDSVADGTGYRSVVEAVLEERLLEKPSSPLAPFLARWSNREDSQP